MVQYKEPIQIVTVTIDYCDLEFGAGACTASLSSKVPHKCFNTFHTCPVRDLFQKGTLDIKFTTEVSKLPIDGNTYFPILKSVSASSATVNLAGSNPKYGSLGKRAKLSATLVDAPSNDTYVDKYQQERISGAAQFSGVGYNPEKFGNMLGKLKARFPNFVNRPAKYEEGYIVDGQIVIERTRHFIWTKFDGPKNGQYTLEFKDVLTLTEEDKKVAPAVSEGYLSVDISDTETEITLTPEGIGSTYGTKGFVRINDEVLGFTRVDDVMTVTRGEYKTEASSHSADDFIQECLAFDNERPNRVVVNLLELAEIDPAFIKTGKYSLETRRWCPTLRLSTIITEPTGISDLLAELAPLGITIWWDDVNQEIGYDVNSPVDVDAIPSYDDGTIKEASSVENDEDRLTTIVFYSVRRDVNGDVEDGKNYEYPIVIIDGEATDPDYFGDSKIRKVYCRWLDHGDGETYINIAAKRLLNRFNTAPRVYTLTFDIDERDNLNLTNVIEVNSDITENTTGLPEPVLTQIISMKEGSRRTDITVEAQRFNYAGNYAYIAANDAPAYDDATEEEKKFTCYLSAEGAEEFDDGYPVYILI